LEPGRLRSLALGAHTPDFKTDARGRIEKIDAYDKAHS
jgi:hypothetical protein